MPPSLPASGPGLGGESELDPHATRPAKKQDRRPDGRRGGAEETARKRCIDLCLTPARGATQTGTKCSILVGLEGRRVRRRERERHRRRRSPSEGRCGRGG